MKSKKTIYLISVFIICSATSSFAQVTWTSIGPGGGSDLIAAAIQPDNPDVIYLAGDIEGVFKTTNGGQSWRMINNGRAGGDRPAGVYGIQELVIDPTNYQTIYACTWSGLYKSTNGGENWEFIFPFPLTEEIEPISFVAVGPDDRQIIYAGIGDADTNQDGTGSLYRSTNGGVTWELLNVGMDAEAVVHGIIIDPTSPQGNRRIFVSTNDGVFRSQDNGATWKRINTDLPHLNTRRLAYNTSGGNLTLFLTMKTEGDPSNPASFKGGIYKSTDGGDNWVSINGDLPTLPYEDPTDPPPFYDYWKFAVTPTNPDIIYIASNLGGWDDKWGIHKTTDGGQHWTKIDTAITYGWLDYVWYDDANVTFLKIAPSDPNILIAGNNVIHKTTNAGQTWEQVYTNPVGDYWSGREIELMESFDMGFHPTDPNVLYIGYDDMGFWRSDDGGQSFKRLDAVLDPGGYDCVRSIVVDPITEDLYIGRSGGDDDDFPKDFSVGQVLKSTDRGENWTFVTGLPEGKPALIMDLSSPANARILYCAVYGHGVFKSTDSGLSWSGVNNGLGGDAVYAWTIVIDPNDNQTLYVGLNTIYGTGAGGVYKTTDGGQNWFKLTNLPSGDVLSFDIDHSNGQTLYAGVTDVYDWSTTGGLYKSTDGGSTWTEVLDQPRVGVVLVHPTQSNVIFAASQPWWNYTPNLDDGLYRSIDGGQTWELINQNLGHTFILFARINPHNPNQIFVGTHGGGIWVGDNIIDSSPSFPVGDVSGDGIVSTYDAILILQFVVGLIDKFPVEKLTVSSSENAIFRDYEVSVPDINVAQGKRVFVPININDVVGLNAGAITLKYNPTVIKAVDVAAFGPLRGAYWQANTEIEGEVRFAFASIEQTRGSGRILAVEFEALSNMEERTSPLILDYVQLARSRSIQKLNGSLTVLPTATRLLQNYPNPFNPETWIPYQLAEDAQVSVQIYDIGGKLMRTLDFGLKPAGFYLTRERAAHWDGRNQFGERVSSGMYFYRITAGGFAATRKMAILK